MLRSEWLPFKWRLICISRLMPILLEESRWQDHSIFLPQYWVIPWYFPLFGLKKRWSLFQVNWFSLFLEYSIKLGFFAFVISEIVLVYLFYIIKIWGYTHTHTHTHTRTHTHTHICIYIYIYIKREREKEGELHRQWTWTREKKRQF